MPKKVSRPATPHRGWLVLMLGALVAFGPLSIDMYLPAIPALALEFGVEQPLIQFSLTAFLVGMAAGQLIYGPLSDRYGRKPLLYFGLSLYALMTIGCAVAPSAHTFILFRLLEALGACAGIVISRATVRDLFTPREAAGVFSLLMLVMGVAPVLAPLAGGYVSVWLGWRAIFWMLAALSLVCLVTLSVLLPETHQPSPQHALRNAFRIYGRLLRDRQFMGYALAGGVAQAGMFAYITGSPFVYIELFGIPAEHFGWLFGLNAIGLIGMAQVNLFLLRRYTLDQILRFSFALIAGIGIFLAGAGLLHGGLWPVAFGLFLFLAALGITFPNTAAGALAEQGAVAGSASALLGTLQFSVGVGASALVNALHNGTSVPMTAVIGGSGMLALLVYRGMITRPYSVETAEACERALAEAQQA